MAHLYVLALVVALAAPSALVVADVWAAEVKEALQCDVDAMAASRRTMTAELRIDGGPVIIPVAGKPAPTPPASRQPAGTVNGLQAVRTKVDTLSTQVKALEASLGQPAWNQAIQPQLASLRGTLTGLQQDVAKLQGVNRSANMNVGIQLFDGVQARAQDLGRAIEGVAQARDATAARGALSQVSVSLGQLAKSYDPPPCCLLTCCAISIQ